MSEESKNRENEETSRGSSRTHAARPTRDELPHDLAERFERRLTLREFAALANRPMGTVYAWVSRGVLPVERMSSRVVQVRQSVAEAFIRGELNVKKAA